MTTNCTEPCSMGKGMTYHGEVDNCLAASDLTCSAIISPCRLLSCVKGAKPQAAALSWVTDLSGILAPGPLPHSTELGSPVLVGGRDT